MASPPRYALTASIMLAFAATAHVAHARCPRRRPGENSDCAYTTCTPQLCALQGLECCPKPCGGSWCVKGEGPPSEYPEICPVVHISDGSCDLSSPSSSCEELGCEQKGFVCCRDGCNSDYCYQVPGSY
ncbi:uncharacterized protein LOC144180325 [Haemaphysalis longicornis]